MTGIKIQNWYLIGFLVLLLVVVARIFAPFFSVFLWSCLLYVIVSPIYKRLVSRLDPARRFHSTLRLVIAGFMAILSVLVVIVPLVFIAFQFVSQLSDVVGTVIHSFEKNPDLFRGLLTKATTFVNDLSMGALNLQPDEILANISSTLSDGVNGAVRFSSELVKNIGTLVLSLLFTVFTLYFFLIDADHLVGLLARAIPIRKDYMKALFLKFKEITRNLVQGYILVAVIQAVMAWVLFTIFGVKSPLAFAAMVMISSLIPMVGASIIWLPLGIARIVSGDLFGGILFLVLSGIFISTLDNFLRPFFLADRIKLHPLVIFFAIMGGILSFGINGLILGPLAVILFLTVLDMFQTQE